MKRIIAAGLWVVLTAANGLGAEPLPIAMVNVDRILRTHKPLLEKLAPLKATSKELDATVQVRIGLPSAEEACRGQITQLGLTLPAPEAAKVMFAKQGESLLMIDSHRMPASAVTSFHFVQKKR